MSYLDQGMSPNKIWAIVIVALVHALLGFAFVTGFANKFIEEQTKDLDVFDVSEPPPPEEPPPPPDEPVPEVQSPQVVTPPPLVQPPRPPQPQIAQTPVPNPYVPPTPRADTQGQVAPVAQPTTMVCPGGTVVRMGAPCPPQTRTCPGGTVVPISAQCPAPARPAAPARLRSGSITNDDYPAAAIRAEASGTSVASIQVGPDGRVTGCSASGSGNGALDATACSLIRRRFRYEAAIGPDGSPRASSATYRVVWRLPSE